MKIVVFEFEGWESVSFKSLQKRHEVIFESEQLTAETADRHSDAEVVSTFIYSQLDTSTLESLPRLQLIATRSTGFDHIDVGYCQQQGISVCNVPGYGENTVAEHVFALLLTISHRLYEALNRTRRGDFSLEGLLG
ncbi:MAG: hydroxyacid dehydrogenase, partial [Deltaproteobacteria bacterium]|nr:hydroxyacid dehydrogenase [Deltaproteobacteria bacterium]